MQASTQVREQVGSTVKQLLCSGAIEKGRDDLLDHAVGEIPLLGIAAHIPEGEIDVLSGSSRRAYPACAGRMEPKSSRNLVHPHRPGMFLT